MVCSFPFSCTNRALSAPLNCLNAWTASWMQYWPRLLVMSSTVFSSALSFGRRKPLYLRYLGLNAQAVLPSRWLPCVPSRHYYLRHSLSSFFLPPSFCAWQLQNCLCHIYWVLLNLILSDSWESSRFSSDCHFCESKYMITYQKISVLDRKKIEAEYNQDF